MAKRRYGEVKHHRSKIAAAWRREGPDTAKVRTFSIQVKVQRSFHYGAQGFRAEACFRKRSLMGRLRCGYGTGNSPSKAAKNAVRAIDWQR